MPISPLKPLLIVSLLLSESVGHADPVTPANPQCPWVNPSNSWQDYVSGKIKSGNVNYFQVRWEFMKKISDPFKSNTSSSPLGTIWKGSCVTVYYAPSEQRWHSSVKGGVTYTSKAIADPQKMQLGISGRAFKFNEAGEVFDLKLGKVGKMRCELLYPVPCMEKFADVADYKRMTGR